MFVCSKMTTNQIPSIDESDLFTNIKIGLIFNKIMHFKLSVTCLDVIFLKAAGFDQFE